MPRLVMKFGGTSVADLDRIRNVARHVRREVNAGYQVAVVVSAMAGETNKLVALCRSAADPARRARIRRRRVGRRAGDGRAARHRAAGAVGSTRAPGSAGRFPICTDSAHGVARITDIRADKLLRAAGAGPGGGDRRLPGRRAGQSHRHARARRLRYQRRRDRRRDRRGALRHLYRRRRCLYDRPAHRSDRATAREGGVRGDAGNGVARLEGAAGALGRARHGARGAGPSCAPHSTTRTRSPPENGDHRAARSFATRTRSWKSSSLPASPIPRTRPRSRFAAWRTSPASPRRSSARSPNPGINVDMIVQNISEDGRHHRHHLHRADRRFRALDGADRGD